MNTSTLHPTALHPATARTTALLYLALAVVAVPGLLVIRPMLFDPESAAVTLSQLVENQTLARVGIGLELALVAAQALVALWFYRLFHRVDTFAAGRAASAMCSTPLSPSSRRPPIRSPRCC